ncbi:hypothetical protein Tco_1130413, partial [Tanacetum coccineum]
MSAKDSIAIQTCELSKKEFNDFLALYPIPLAYHVILPKSNQTIFDAPPGYVRLYTHSFSLANLRLPLTEFFCKVLEYFQLTFVKRPEKHIPYLFPKVITRIDGWKKRFFYVQNSIVPAKYPQLLLEQNKFDSKFYKDKLPPNIEQNPMFQRLGHYRISVRVFLDPILFLAGLQSLNFVYAEDEEDLSFLPKEPSPGFDSGGSPKPELFVVHPGSVAARIKDKKCKIRGGSSRPPMKRKLASGSLNSRAKTSTSKDDVPFLTVSDYDEAWKNHLDNHMDVELLDL